MSDLRVGIGVDAHAFEEGARLVLGGVGIEHPRGLAGHSDGDVVAEAGFTLVNADCILIGEEPRIAEHREEMRRRLAGALAVEPERVNVRATTTDRLGFTGRGEGLAAEAVALLERT